MQKSDSATFLKVMNGLAEVYGEEIGEMRQGIYLRALSHLDIRAIQYAAGEHVKTSRFFPKPAELIDLARDWRPPAVEAKEAPRQIETTEQQDERRARHKEGFSRIRERLERLDEEYGTNITGIVAGGR